MRITFMRSGGFAGKATEVDGAVTFGESGAEVTANGGNYHRELLAAEAKQLIADAAVEAAPGESGAGGQPTQPDAYQYDVSIVTAEGKTRRLRFGASTSQVTASAGLTKWVQDEVQKIWEARIADRSKLPQ